MAAASVNRGGSWGSIASTAPGRFGPIPPMDLALPCSSAPSPGRVLVLGGGYTGGRFAAALRLQGVSVCLTHRQPPATPDPRPWLRLDPAAGVYPTTADLAGTTHVLVTIPPDGAGRDPVLDQLGPLLRQLPVQWLGYLSTTGVYGDTGGAWVDETSPTVAGLGRSQARLRCEEGWRALGLPLQVFRLPAIYGPGRTPFDSLRNGTARLIHKSGQVFSRVHVDDIVGALLHCLVQPASERPPTVIVADTTPCPSSETLGYAAHLLGCKLPDVVPYDALGSELSPMARSFWSENRRASSRLLREELGYRLRYPTFREGYRACLP